MGRDKIRVLVVDDSALMRKHLRELLIQTGEFDVSVARDGVDALEQLRAVDPHVITLDVNMPEMDGLTCLARIMTESPKPVLMVSSLTQAGAEVTYEALALGAVDFIPKPDGTISLTLRDAAQEIVAKVRAAADARVRPRGAANRVKARIPAEMPATPRKRDAQPRLQRDARGVVIVGVSTGGPRTLEDILPHLPASFPWPIVIAQHMPATFTGAFARRLDGICKLSVEEVTRRSVLAPGYCYIGRGDADLVIQERAGQLMALCVPAQESRVWHPSVGRLVETALACMKPEHMIGVMLTGLGDDGADAMTELYRRGGQTIAEAQSSAIVFGMPGALVGRGGAATVLPATQIAYQLTTWLAATSVNTVES